MLRRQLPALVIAVCSQHILDLLHENPCDLEGTPRRASKLLAGLVVLGTADPELQVALKKVAVPMAGFA